MFYLRIWIAFFVIALVITKFVVIAFLDIAPLAIALVFDADAVFAAVVNALLGIVIEITPLKSLP